MNQMPKIKQPDDNSGVWAFGHLNFDDWNLFVIWCLVIGILKGQGTRDKGKNE